MNNFTIEQVDYLREKADITYEEAVSLLDHYQGDLARCLIDLERHGRIRPQPFGRTETHARGAEHAWNQHASGYERPFDGDQRPKAFVMDWTLAKNYLFSRVTVKKGDTVIANLSVLYLAAAVLFAPHLMFFSILAMFLLGYRIHWNKHFTKTEQNHEQQVYDFVDKAAKNIKKTATSFAEAVKFEVKKAQNAPTAPQAQPEQPAQPVQPVQPQPPVQPFAPEEDIDDTDPSEMTIE